MAALLLGSELVDLTRDPVPRRARRETEFTPLFDGTETHHWQMAGAGHFAVVDGRLESVPADELGLFWCTTPTPPDFVLCLRWLRWRHDDISGVFVRFPRPAPPADGNAASVATQRGFEVRIDEVGLPVATAIHKTGAISNQRRQRLDPRPARPAAEWNDLEIRVCGQRYQVALNNHLVATFDNDDATRGLASTAAVPSFLGLQVYPGSRMAFRDLRIKAL